MLNTENVLKSKCVFVMHEVCFICLQSEQFIQECKRKSKKQEKDCRNAIFLDKKTAFH